MGNKVTVGISAFISEILGGVGDGWNEDLISPKPSLVANLTSACHQTHVVGVGAGLGDGIGPKSRSNSKYPKTLQKMRLVFKREFMSNQVIISKL